MPGLTMLMTPEADASSALSALPPQDVADRLASMREQQEATAYRRCNYMDNAASPSRHCSPTPGSRRKRSRRDVIDRDCRSKMVDWCFHVSDFCKFQRETVAMAMSYMDRFLATASPRAARAMTDKREFQLLAMACLYISIKIFEPLAMDAKLLSQISHGCYDEDDIVEMEVEVLKWLGWKVNGPTAHAFIEHVVALLPPAAYGNDPNTAATLLDFSRFQADIAVGDYDLSLLDPSTLALAAITNSIEGIEKALFPAANRFRFFRLLHEATGLNALSLEVNAARARLLDLFASNSGYDLPQVANLTPVSPEKMVSDDDEEDAMIVERRPSMSSPVCVSRHFESEPRTKSSRRRASYGAHCA